MSWITPREYSKVNHLANKGVTRVEPANVIKYGWEDAKVAGTLTVLNTEATIKVADIVVDDPRDWSVLPMSPVKRISSFFDDCTIPLYEFLSQNLKRLS